MKKFLLAILCLAGVSIGCVSVNATRLNSNVEYPAVDPNDVVVYMSEQDVNAPFTKVALINSSGSSAMTNEDSLIESMKQKAAEMGANGLVLNDLEDANTGEKIAGAVLGVDTQRHGQAVAIYVKKRRKQDEDQ